MSDTRDPATDQALPVVNDRPFVQDLVVADVEARKQLGIRKYGTALQAGNGRNMLLDAYEEALDLAIYLRGALEEQEHVTPLLAHRDTLAAVLARHVPLTNGSCSCGHYPVASLSEFASHQTDALFASGAVRDAASLPDDIELTDRIAELVPTFLASDPHSWPEERHLRALAAALAPTEEKA